MKSPARITFHQMDPSPALEHTVSRMFAKLETLSDRIVSCHVLIEAPHKRQHQGRRYRVRVEIGRGEIVADRAPDQDASHEDAHVAVRDAFRAAERQLQHHLQSVRRAPAPEV